LICGLISGGLVGQIDSATIVVSRHLAGLGKSLSDGSSDKCLGGAIKENYRFQAIAHTNRKDTIAHKVDSPHLKETVAAKSGPVPRFFSSVLSICLFTLLLPNGECDGLVESIVD